MTTTPTPPGFRAMLQDVCTAMDAFFNADPAEPRIGFVLLAFPMVETDSEAEVSFITNTTAGDSRVNIPRAIRQAADRIEAAQQGVGHA